MWVYFGVAAGVVATWFVIRAFRGRGNGCAYQGESARVHRPLGPRNK